MIPFYKWLQIMRFPDSYYAEYVSIATTLHNSNPSNPHLDEDIEKLMRERARNRIWWRKNIHNSNSDKAEKTDTS